MIRATLDANVVASGVVGIGDPASPPGAILLRWERHEFELLTSEALIAEIAKTLRNPYFASRVYPDLIAVIVSSLLADATVVTVVESAPGVATHPEDDLVLAAAVAGEADHLVTGDRQLLKLGTHRGVHILSPRDCLAVLDAETEAGADRVGS